MTPPRKTKDAIHKQLAQANRELRRLKKKAMSEQDLKAENDILKAKCEMPENLALREHSEMVSQDSIHADDLAVIATKLDEIITLLKPAKHGP